MAADQILKFGSHFLTYLWLQQNVPIICIFSG